MACWISYGCIISCYVGVASLGPVFFFNGLGPKLNPLRGSINMMLRLAVGPEFLVGVKGPYTKMYRTC